MQKDQWTAQVQTQPDYQSMLREALDRSVGRINSNRKTSGTVSLPSLTSFLLMCCPLEFFLLQKSLLRRAEPIS